MSRPREMLATLDICAYNPKMTTQIVIRASRKKKIVIRLFIVTYIANLSIYIYLYLKVEA